MNIEQYDKIKRIARSQAIIWTAFVFGILWFLGLMWAPSTGPAPLEWDASAAYTDTAEAPHGLVDVAPHFAGLETGTSSESIHFVNEYGDCGWEVNECWLTDFIGVAPAAPHNILSATHLDSVVSAVNVGDIIVGTAGGWDDLPVAINGDVLTLVAGAPQWVAPVVAAAWVQIAEQPVVMAGADYTVRGGAALAGTAEDVVVKVVCRTANGGTCWSALSSFTPVASFVTYTWGDDGAGNLEVRIYNDSQIDLYATASYIDLG